MGDKSFNAFEMAQQQFDNAADMLELDEVTRELLRNPMKEFHFSIPVTMDDGRKKVFRGFRCMHNDARGPAKGGIRFHPQETIDIVRALSMLMTWKTSVADIPLGGGNGGVICDPHNLSNREQEQICRGWVRQIYKNVGPFTDIPAPDVMTNPQHMLWMLDEYEVMSGKKQPGFITGKPVGMGGSLGRMESAGYGVIINIREALKKLSLKANATSMSIQGFGNVSQYAIELYIQMGGKVICVSCWDQKDEKSYSFKKENGIDLKELKNISDQFGGIDKSKAEELGYEVLDGNEWLVQEVDILIPAAMENQITEDNVEKISSRVKIIAEGAHGPTTPEADKIIESKEIFLIPDFLANAGGVICSYFEQVQCNMNYFWTKDEVLGKLDQKMTFAFNSVYQFSNKNNMSMRVSANIMAIEKVVDACKGRGWV
ncbi:MAG: Glu/Leu/Phe/Val dehydrogenase [Candidatus Delongbacteria bacterium]|jgi:glutamate dehydrogenase|nr:Glu/Leu/Phe/Val dehydrogenase [Candidatus Delongbacteria bacterium]